MSETEHHRGIIKEIESLKNETIEETAKRIIDGIGLKIDDYYDSALEYLQDELYETHYFHSKSKKFYTITDEDIDPDGGIIRARKLNDNMIEYELRFYNGGASFSECLDKAIDSL